MLVMSDDPPIHMSYGAPPLLGKEEKDPTHTANFGAKLQEKLKETARRASWSISGFFDVEAQSSDGWIICLNGSTKICHGESLKIERSSSHHFDVSQWLGNNLPLWLPASRSTLVNNLYITLRKRCTGPPCRTSTVNARDPTDLSHAEAQ